jgi:CheY-like chemotaxis protein
MTKTFETPVATSTIMVLDDEPVVKRLIHEILKNHGYHVLLFNTEEEMLQLDQAEQGSLLLLDIQLKNVNGIDVLARLKANPRYRDIPVIMITADSKDSTLETCFLLGASDYITKPFQPLNLKSRIQSAIDRARKITTLQHEIDNLSKERQLIGDENQKHEKRIFALEMAHKELSETTQHLATATWRERQRKDELNAALNELKIMSRKVEQSRGKILNSINYAQRIQSAFLPSGENMQKLFQTSFALYLPKDIVSGDFYWCCQAGPLNFIGTFDCTGHGVPGAFMSIIGMSLLNEIVKTKAVHDVDQILNHLHDGVYSLLHQGESDNKDGMEATLCCIDTANKVMHFAGSGNPLIYFKNNECHTVKGSVLAIGGRRTKEATFERHVIDLQGLQEVYLCSDGLQDQFGGPATRKMGLKNILSFLTSMHHQPMDMQKAAIQEYLNDWMKAGRQVEKQTDDILLIGFRLS